MRLIFFVASFMLFFTVFSLICFSQNVGVSPGKIDLGEVEKGSTKLVNFYVISPSDETLLVKLEPEMVDMYGNRNINDFSEEDMTSWVKIINNPVELRPVNETLKTTGGAIKGQREISFLIEIPKNAEPGYHTVNINPIPSKITETAGPVGSAVVSITSFKVFLNVIGDVVRKGSVLDVETGSYSGNNLEIKTYFQNTGTVTIASSGTQKFYDKDGKLIKEIYLGRSYVKPKEIRVFKGFLPTNGLSLGDYTVYTVIDFTTDSAEKSSTIKLTLPTPTTLAAKHEENMLTILVIAIVAIFIISLIIYRRIK